VRLLVVLEPWPRPVAVLHSNDVQGVGEDETPVDAVAECRASPGLRGTIAGAH
jgi:hypothetical protein